MKSKIENHKIWIYNLIAIIFLLIIGLLNLRNNTSLKIVGDEFGYWAGAAYLNGMDWSSVVSHNAYYGYGYGFLLGIIYLFNLSATLSYQLAIVVNVILLCIIFGCIEKTINYLFPNVTEGLSILIALVTSLYTGYLYYTQFTLSEILLTAIFWLIIVTGCQILIKPSIIKLIIFVLLNLWGYATH